MVLCILSLIAFAACSVLTCVLYYAGAYVPMSIALAFAFFFLAMTEPDE